MRLPRAILLYLAVMATYAVMAYAASVADAQIIRLDGELGDDADLTWQGGPDWKPAPVAEIEITVEGPDECAVGEQIRLNIGGAPPIDPDVPVNEQLEWATGNDRLVCGWLAPEYPAEAVKLRFELVLGQQGLMFEPFVRVTPDVPGEHRLVIDWNYGRNQLVFHTVVAVGENDDGDGDDGDPPLPPLERMTLTIIEEAETRGTSGRGPTQYAHLELVAQYLESLGRPFRIWEEDEPIAENFKRLLSDGGYSLPAVVATDEEHNVLVIEEFGATPADTIEALKSQGIRK